MKIIIKNLGPISKFEFDLSKDLNIIFGKNNIGKSYAITVVYLILKNLINQFSSPKSGRPLEVELFYLRRTNGRERNESPLSKLVNEVEKKIIDNLKSKKSNDEYEITDSIETIFKEILNEFVIQSIENSFKNSFSSIEDLTNKMTNEKLRIELEYENFQVSIEAKGDKLAIKDIKLTKKIFVKQISSNRKPLFNADRITIYHNKKSNTINLVDDYIIFLYASFRHEITSLINNVYFLPASRSGLYQALSTFSAVIAELSKSRTFLTTRIELPNISEPVSDYFLNLSNISTRVSNEYKEIVEQIESEILKGRILFNKESKKIVFNQDEIHAELDLSFTSSMISEIAPIVAYLKFALQRGNSTNAASPISQRRTAERNTYNLFFIEEPEAHLHPSIQVQLMEIFAKLIDKRVKIVMTTHSNYMFNKLSNLILDSKVSYERVGSYLMTATPKGSVVDVIKMKADEEGIQDENFADVAEKLYEERIHIYDKLNTSDRDVN